jgi:hypothetical protein
MSAAHALYREAVRTRHPRRHKSIVNQWRRTKRFTRVLHQEREDILAKLLIRRLAMSCILSDAPISRKLTFGRTGDLLDLPVVHMGLALQATGSDVMRGQGL